MSQVSTAVRRLASLLPLIWLPPRRPTPAPGEPPRGKAPRIRFVCPQCGARGTFPAAVEGRYRCCPKCRKTIAVADAAAAPRSQRSRHGGFAASLSAHVVLLLVLGLLSAAVETPGQVTLTLGDDPLGDPQAELFDPDELSTPPLAMEVPVDAPADLTEPDYDELEVDAPLDEPVVQEQLLDESLVESIDVPGAAAGARRAATGG